MASLLDGLAEPFTPIEPAAARAALAEHWGIETPELTRLETERDDTFRAGSVTLKVAHPNDAPDVIDFQIAVLQHLGSAGLPVQEVVPTTSGALSATIEGRVGRVLTWLDGDLMDDHEPSDAQLRDVGSQLGRLNRSLAGFTHPAAKRDLAWDLARLPELRPHTDDPYLVDLIDRFAAYTAPRLAALPHQVIHNDVHPGNVLVAPADPARVVGILDVGDALHTARVCDLGVAVAYVLPDAESAWAAARPLIDAFDAETPLLDEERALLPELVIARLIMRIVINQAMNPPDPGLDRFFERQLRSIHRVLKEA
jgi:hydroxylysine kinase